MYVHGRVNGLSIYWNEFRMERHNLMITNYQHDCPAHFSNASGIKSNEFLASEPFLLFTCCIIIAGQFPHQVAIRDVANNTFLVSGSIISNRHVLTVAHRLTLVGNTLPLANVRVFAGSNRINEGTQYQISHLIRHPTFDFQRRLNNVAVIRTINEILFTSVVLLCSPSVCRSQRI